MAASTYKADNLIAIVDYNKYCIDGPVNAVIGLEPFAERWKSFGWWVTEINGHDIAQIVDTLDLTDNLYGDGKPKCIIAHTVKGKGIDYWEARHSHTGRGPLMEEGLKEGIAKYLK
jgi:transketolase